MRHGLVLSGFLGLALAAGVCTSASDADPGDERTPRLGSIVNTAPHRSGLMYLAPGRIPDTPRESGVSPQVTLQPDGRRKWSPQWIDDCAARHKGFDPQTGTYLAANGEYKFCD